jgi:hypothetical protein
MAEAIRARAFGFDTEPATGFAKRPRAIGTPVVGQHPLDADAVAAEFAQCANQKLVVVTT